MVRQGSRKGLKKARCVRKCMARGAGITGCRKKCKVKGASTRHRAAGSSALRKCRAELAWARQAPRTPVYDRLLLNGY